MERSIVKVYTDGSYNPQFGTGSWAALLLFDNERVLLKDIVKDSTHQRMELMAVVMALKYINSEKPEYKQIHVYTDSQYIADLPERTEKLKRKNFLTKKGSFIRNFDLIQKLLEICQFGNIKFVKVKAHDKKTFEINYNREVDMEARRLLRKTLREIKE